MKSATRVLRAAATAVALVQMAALYASAAGERQQQLPLFFQGGRPFNAPGAPLPKFVGIAGNQQPQAFRSVPPSPPQVDEELQEDEEQRDDEEPHQRNVLVPTPLPFRPQPTQQVSWTSGPTRPDEFKPTRTRGFSLSFFLYRITRLLCLFFFSINAFSNFFVI